MSQRNVDDDNEFDRIYRMLSRCQTELQRQKPVIEAARVWYSGVYLRRERIGAVMGSKETTLAECIKALNALEGK